MAARWDHVLVDEYQDVNQIQVDIVRAAAPGRARADRGRRRRAGGLRLPRRGQRHLLDLTTDARRRHRRPAGTQLPVPAAAARPGQRGPTRRRRVRPACCARTAPAAARPRLVRCHDAPAEARAVVDAVLAAAEDGRPLRDQAVLMRAGHHSDLLEVELTARRRAVRQVRRAEVPGSRARQGLRRRVAAAGQPRSTRSPGSGCCACTTASGRPGPGACSTPLDPATADADAAARRRGRRRAGRRPDRARRAPSTGCSAARAAARDRRTGPRGVPGLLRPLLTRRYPDHAARLADLDRLVGAAATAPDSGRVRRRADPRPARVDRRPRRAAAPGRGLPGAVHRALGQGPGMAGRARHPPRRRRVPVRHGAVAADAGLIEEQRLFYVARHPGPRRARRSTRRCGCRTTATAATTSTASPRSAGSSTTTALATMDIIEARAAPPGTAPDAAPPGSPCPPWTTSGPDRAALVQGDARLGRPAEPPG